jgi:hypothetical protein
MGSNGNWEMRTGDRVPVNRYMKYTLVSLLTFIIGIFSAPAVRHDRSEHLVDKWDAVTPVEKMEVGPLTVYACGGRLRRLPTKSLVTQTVSLRRDRMAFIRNAN